MCFFCLAVVVIFLLSQPTTTACIEETLLRPILLICVVASISFTFQTLRHSSTLPHATLTEINAFKNSESELK